jgi:uncharacterized protein (TIGR03118 family)
LVARLKEETVMREARFITRHVRVFAGLILASCLLMMLFPIPLGGGSASAQKGNVIVPDVPPIPPGSAYRQTNFISDIAGMAFTQDPFLINPWGIAFRGTSPFWVSQDGTSSAALFRGDLSGSPLVLNPGLNLVTVPGGLPTGVVGNSTTDFGLTPCSVASCPAAFIFSSITGNIVGWNPSAGPNSTTGVIAASHAGHVYTGLAIGSNSGGNRLYAADFNNGNIDVYDGTYTLTTTTGGFVDPTIPTVAGNTFHPYNIQNIGGLLYVTYAKVGTDGKAESGVGNGFVRRFNTDGVRDLTFGINNGALNAPWGIAIAPSTFGIFGSALLIGNFGEGNPSLHAYNPTTGAFLGTIQNENGDGIVIDELWGLQFGNGVNGDLGTLYFTAGTGEEEHGLFGSLKPTTATATSLIQFATDDFAINEGAGHIDIGVIRAGDVSGPATVNFNTFDESQVAHASQKSDFEISLGKVTFNPGETAKTVRILLVNDLFVEGNETVNLALSNPIGAGVGLGTPNTAQLRIIDNDSVAPLTNPIDDSTFFVRQHYLDFLNREPDTPGLNFWVNEIESCGLDAVCREVKRISVSAAFFQSIEFQKTGLEAYLTHRAAFGNLPPNAGAAVPVFYGTFERDTQALGKDFIFGQPGADAQIEANTVAYFNDFVTRPEFVGKYPSTLTNDQFVDNLLATAGLSPTNFIVRLTNSQENPPTNPTTTGGGRRSASFGTATFNMNTAQTQMTFTATVNNIDFTAAQSADANDNLVAAHIHAGPSVAPGVNGPVVWGFFGAPLNDTNPPDVVNNPFTGLGNVGGTISGKWDAPEGNGTTFAAQLTNLKTGHAYINFHTTQFGGGEVRGNFPEMDAFRTSLVNGLNAATDTRATVMRKVAEYAFLKDRELNNAFVFMEYAGYLRRDPDVSGFNFWLNKLNSFNSNFVDAEMVKAFISSGEYRQRFGA